MALELKIILDADDGRLNSGLQAGGKQVDQIGKKMDQATAAGRRHGRMARSLNRAYGSLSRGAGALSRTLFSLKGLLVGAGVGLIAKSFISAASTSEQYRVRLNALLGSVEEGNRLFRDMSKFASEVPFEYEKIMAAATQLSGVMAGGVDEINQWMPMIGDLAAVSGLSIEQTTEQVVRMYSAGAGAADLFRERGITAMLGFQAGASYSAEETRKKLIEAFEDPMSKFRGASKELAKTWDGVWSMISDKWFAIRNAIMDAGLFDYIKEFARILDSGMGDALESTQAQAVSWADSVISGIEGVLSFVGLMADGFRGLKIIWQGLKIVWLTISASISQGILNIQVKLFNMAAAWNVMAAKMGAGFAAIDLAPLANKINASSQRMAELKTETDEAKQKLQELAMEKLPSQKIQEFADRAREAAENSRIWAEMQEDNAFMADKVTEAVKKTTGAVGELSKEERAQAAARAKQLASSLTQLLDSLKTEREKTEEWYAESLQLLEDTLGKKKGAEQEYAEWKERLDGELQERLAELDSQALEDREERTLQTMERIHDFSVDIINAIFEEGRDPIDALTDYFKDRWKQVLKDMLVYFLDVFFAKIVNSFLGWNIPMPGFPSFGFGGGSFGGGVGGPVGIGGTVGTITAVADAAAATPIIGPLINALIGGSAAAVGGGASWLAANAAFNAGNVASFIPGLTWGSTAATTAGAAAGAAPVAGSGLFAGLSETMAGLKTGITNALTGIKDGISGLFGGGSGGFSLGSFANFAIPAFAIGGFINAVMKPSKTSLARDDLRGQAKQAGGFNQLDQMLSPVTQGVGLLNQNEFGLVLKLEGDTAEIERMMELIGQVSTTTLLTQKKNVEALGGAWVQLFEDQITPEILQALDPTPQLLELTQAGTDQATMQITGDVERWKEIMRQGVAVDALDSWRIYEDEQGRIMTDVEGNIQAVLDYLTTATAAATVSASDAFNAMAEDETIAFDNLRMAIRDQLDEIPGYAEQVGEAFSDGILTDTERTALGIERFGEITMQTLQDAIDWALGLGNSVDELGSNWDGLLPKIDAIADAIANMPDLPAYTTQPISGGPAAAGLPGFAGGGVVHAPTLAWVGEGGRSEAIVPLPDGRSIPVRIEGGGAPAIDLRPVVTGLERIERRVVELEGTVGRPIAESFDRADRRRQAQARPSC